MSKIFPIQSERELDLDSPTVVELGSKESEVYLDALSSRTTRDIFVEIYQSPSTISSLSDYMDSSIQNTKYHVEKLQESNLIEVVGTDHSENGNEMDVYGPTSEAIVFLVGREEEKSLIRDRVKTIGVFLTVASIVSVAFSYIASFESTKDSLTTPLTKESLETQSTRTPDSGASIESSNSLNTSSQPTDSVFDMVIGSLEVSPDLAMPVIILLSLVSGVLLYKLSSEILTRISS